MIDQATLNPFNGSEILTENLLYVRHGARSGGTKMSETKHMFFSWEGAHKLVIVIYDK